jgi:small subunit ribosomal protein S18
MKPKKKQKRLRPVARNCNFCDNNTVPDYKDVTMLGKFMTERGKVLASSRTGICSRHQRDVMRVIKQARHVALLPFIVRA